MKSERGQAVVFAAVLIGIGALAIVSLRVTQERMIASAVARDAGEAAIQAAAAVVADAYVAHIERLSDGTSDMPRRAVDVAGLLSDPVLREHARAAAADLAAHNGGVFDGPVDARCAGRAIELQLHLAERTYRAAVEAEACSPR